MFKIAKMRPLAERPMEYYEGTDSEDIKLGEALVLANGKLTKCGATVMPEFISVGATIGERVPVVRVMEEDTFEAPLSAAGTSLKVGDKVTLDTDGLQVTATTENGVFTLTKINGTEIGDTVEGMFRR